MSARSEFPLTRFLATLLGYPLDRLAAADPDKAASHYGISRDHAVQYIRQQRELRGIATERKAA